MPDETHTAGLVGWFHGRPDRLSVRTHSRHRARIGATGMGPVQKPAAANVVRLPDYRWREGRCWLCRARLDCSPPAEGNTIPRRGEGGLLDMSVSGGHGAQISAPLRIPWKFRTEVRPRPLAQPENRRSTTDSRGWTRIRRKLCAAPRFNCRVNATLGATRLQPQHLSCVYLSPSAVLTLTVHEDRTA